jgi:hypothetical protein
LIKSLDSTFNCFQYQIGAWPTFKLFRQGRMYDYNGPRERENIVTFMKAQAKPPSEEKTHHLGISNNLVQML